MTDFSPAFSPAPARWSGLAASTSSTEHARRLVVRRVVATGDWVLDAPLHLGASDESDVDLPLLSTLPMDGTAPRPLLPGATLAGALRSYLRSLDLGDRRAFEKQDLLQEQDLLATKLFGGLREDDAGLPSLVEVDDAVGVLPTGAAAELRTGVSLNPQTHTAQQEGLYDFEVWPAGTRFPLCLELVLLQDLEKDAQKQLKEGFGLVLDALARGEISLGLRKNRGFGRGTVGAWHVQTFDLTTANGMLAWLGRDDSAPGSPVDNVFHALGVPPPPEASLRRPRRLRLDATFALDGSLLMRGADAPSASSPDNVHLHAYRPEKGRTPVVPGTGVAGALRARASRILRVLGADDRVVAKKINDLFGSNVKGQLTGSRLLTHEHALEHVESGLVHARVSIDRFTGGALDTALFDEQAVWGLSLDESALSLRIDLLNASEADAGLLLLLLKDLWTGDLTLGGQRSVGRGRLRGLSATVAYNGAQWTLRPDVAAHLSDADRDAMQACVDALRNELHPSDAS